jgi:hypothetical protein
MRVKRTSAAAALSSVIARQKSERVAECPAWRIKPVHPVEPANVASICDTGGSTGAEIHAPPDMVHGDAIALADEKEPVLLDVVEVQ